MIRGLLLIAFIWSGLSSANTKWKLRQELATATNFEELKSSSRNLNSYLVYEETCEYELQQKLIPVNCYQWIYLKFELKLVTEVQLRHKIKQLNSECLRNSQNIQNIELLNQSNHLSATCAEAIRTKIAELLYQQEETLQRF